jgi:predicted RNA-binding protein YlxR (DUF448 family)
LRLDAAEQKTELEPEAEESIRRCALSRVRRSRDELIRFVLDPLGVIVPDLKGKLPGRGVWLTAAHDIVAGAAKRNVFARALKAETKVPKGLGEQVDKLLAEAALGAFALANKAGEVVFGFAKIEEAIAKSGVIALVHAREAAEDGCRKLDGKARGIGGAAGIPSVRAFGSDELGLASGRTNVIHAALIPGGAARKFLAAALRVERYREGSTAFVDSNGPDTD